MISECFEAFNTFDASLEAEYYNKEIKFPALPPNDSKLPPKDESMLLQEMSNINHFNFPEDIEKCLEIVYKRVSNDTKSTNDKKSAKNKSIMNEDKDSSSNIKMYLLNLSKRAQKPAKLVRLVISFILTLMERSNVYDNVFYDKSFKATDLNDLLFNQDIFSDDPTEESYEFEYVKIIDFILYKWACGTSKEGQLFLFNEILHYSYAEGASERRIYNFLPFFVHLYKDQEHSELYDIYISSELFSRIITESENDIILFDIFRLFIEKQPFQSFLLNNSIESQVSNFYFKANYKGTIKEIIIASLKYIIETERVTSIAIEEMRSIKIIEKIINKCNEKEGNQPEIEGIYETLIKYFPQVSYHLFEYIIKENIFENLAQISIFSQSLFENYIQLITHMYIYHYEFSYCMSSHKYKIYEIMKEYDKTLPSLDIFERLSFCSESEDNENKYLRNYKGIELMVSLSHLMGKQEEEFSQFLLSRTRNAGNILELNRAKIPDFILKRLSEIKRGESTEIVKNYLDLFKMITGAVFNNASFYRTIETINQKSFEYGNEIIEIIKELLKNDKHNKKNQKEEEKEEKEEKEKNDEEPASFVRLDASLGSGIFYPQLWTDSISKLSISFCIRVNQIRNERKNDSNSPISLPLLSIQSTTSSSRISVEIDDGEIYVKERNEKNKESNRQKLETRIDQSRWEFLQFIFVKKPMFKKELILVHNEQELPPIKLNNSIPENGTILIGSESQEDNSPSLICDISTIVITEGDERIKRRGILHTEELKLNDRIISELNPVNSHEGILLDIYNNSQETTKYRGRSVPFVPNIYEVFQTVGSLTNILPLFERKQKNDEETTQFYISLIQIFQEMVNITEKVKEIFLESHFFELLLSFLLGIDKKYLTYDLIQEIYKLYNEVYPIEELRYQMAQYIVLNYYFIINLDEPVSLKIVNELLPMIIKDSTTDSYHYTYLPSFIYQTYEYFSYDYALPTSDLEEKKKETSETAWHILTNMIKHNLSYIKSEFDEETSSNLANKYIMMVFKLMMNLETNYSITKSLEVLKNLLNEGYYEETKETLKDDLVISQLTELMSQKSSTIQILTLEIIDTIKEEIDLHKAVYQCACEFTGRNDITSELVNKIFSLFIVNDENDKRVQFNADYLPLLTVCCSIYVKKDKKLITSICEKFTAFLAEGNEECQSLLTVPCWYDLMRDLYRSVYDPTTEFQLFASPFSLLLVKEFCNCNNEPISKLFYSLDYSDIQNTRKVKRFILSHLIHENQVNQNQTINIFPLIFDHLYFERTTSYSEVSSCTIKLREVNEENLEEQDVELSSTLILSLLDQQKDLGTKTIAIDDLFEVNLLLAMSLLASKYLTTKQSLYIEILQKIKSNFNDIYNDLYFECSSILVEPFIDHEYTENEAEMLNEIESFDQFLIRKGKKVKNETIIKTKNKIIENIIRYFLALQGYFLSDAQKVITERYLDKDNNSRLFYDEEDDDDEENDYYLMITFLSSSIRSVSNRKSKKNKKVKFTNRIFMLEKTKEYRSEIKRIIAMKKSFLQSISKMPGPWLNEKDRDAKYKAFNCISKKGRRILLKINKNYEIRGRSISNADTSQTNIFDEVDNEFHIPYNTPENDDEFNTNINQFNVTLQKVAIKYEGSLKFTNKSLLFVSQINDDDFNDNNDDDIENANLNSCKKVLINFKNIVFILNRRVFREEKACEIFLDNYKSYFIIFTNQEERTRFYQEIDKQIKENNESSFIEETNKFDFFKSLRLKCNCVYQNKASIELIKDLKLVTMWQTRQLTNYEYIYYLNMLGGRSFNYQNQYPIFPILLKDFDGEEFNIEDDSMYRNLSLPPLKLNPESFELIINKYKNIQEEDCLYYTTPSNCQSVESVLCRVEPFASLHNFDDDVNNQFYSIPAKMHDEYYKGKNQSLVEIVPEFYTLPVMLVNENKFNFGKRTQEPEMKIDDVVLPNWCHYSDDSQLLNSSIFTSVSRIALESEYTSKNLNKWIDLYFTKGRGYCTNDLPKSRDKRKYQMYQSYAYPENQDVKYYTNKVEVSGMLPEILFEKSHPTRNSLKQQRGKSKQQSLPATKSEIVSLIKGVALCKDRSLVDIRSQSNLNDSDLKVPETIGDLQCVIRHSKTEAGGSDDTLAVFCTKSNPFVTIVNLNGQKRMRGECHVPSAVTAVSCIGGRILVTGCSDCSVALWKVSFAQGNRGDFNVSLISSSSFHADKVVAVGGCYENGLIVSLDCKNVLVFETASSRNFINFADLGSRSSDQASTSMIKVFKSGIVAVSQGSKVIFFDCHGRQLHVWDIGKNFNVFGSVKIYGHDTREFLAVGHKSDDDCRINVFDLTTFRQTVTKLTDKCNQLCAMKNARSLVVSGEKGLFTVDLESPTQIIRQNEK